MSSPELTELLEELLDAHLDTIELAPWAPVDPRWQAHLEYLRALQRRSCELLAVEVAAG